MTWQACAQSLGEIAQPQAPRRTLYGHPVVSVRLKREIVQEMSQFVQHLDQMVQPLQRDAQPVRCSGSVQDHISDPILDPASGQGLLAQLFGQNSEKVAQWHGVGVRHRHSGPTTACRQALSWGVLKGFWM